MNSISPASSVLPITAETSDQPGPVAPRQISIPSSSRNLVAHGLLQASHRIGAVALLATLGTWVAMYFDHNFHLPLAVAAGASDLGFCLALLGRLLIHHHARLRREANGIAIFNLVLFILSLYFILITRLPVIRASATEFFSPTEQRQ